MNEQDKRAFAEAAKGWATKSAGKDLGEYFFQAALEYAWGKQEPVAYCNDKVLLGHVGECASVAAVKYWTNGDWVDKRRVEDLKYPLYAHPAPAVAQPPADVVRELVEAIQAVEIDSDECLDFDECTAMLVPLDTYHRLTAALEKAKEHGL